MANKTWSMNDTQRQFVEVLKNYDKGVTLFELKLIGREFKTGSINTLVSKGIVEITGDREFACDIVFNGVVVGKATKTGKVYKLVSNDQFGDNPQRLRSRRHSQLRWRLVVPRKLPTDNDWRGWQRLLHWKTECPT